MRAENINIKTSPSLKRTIDSFDDRQYWAFSNTTKDDLHILFNELLFPKEITLPNGSIMKIEV